MKWTKKIAKETSTAISKTRDVLKAAGSVAEKPGSALDAIQLSIAWHDAISDGDRDSLGETSSEVTGTGIARLAAAAIITPIVAAGTLPFIAGAVDIGVFLWNYFNDVDIESDVNNSFESSRAAIQRPIRFHSI